MNKMVAPPVVADAERTVGEIGHCRTSGGRGDDGCPIKEGIKFLGKRLPDDQRHKQRQEQRGAEQIAPMKRHRDGIAAGLAQRGGGDLNDPEYECDFRNLGQGLIAHAGILRFCADAPLLSVEPANMEVWWPPPW